jgi:hypothetical protein
MRAVTVIGVLLAAGAGTLRAQHAHQLEIGGFGSYNRYDKQFLLDNQFGGGGRLAFYFNDYLGLEVDGNLAYPFPKAGGPHTQVRTGSASLVINSGGTHNILYVLGGFSYIDMGVNPPYNFHLLAGHGGLGDRIFLTDRLALRLEARAYYAPSSCCLSSSWVGHVVGSAGLSFFIGGGGGPHEELPPPIPKEKRDSIIAAGGKPPEAPRPTRGGPTYEQRTGDWAHKWYWGAQGGLFVFKTNFDSYAFEPTFGGHWLVTGKRTALYVAYEQSFFLSDRHTTLVEPDGTVEPGNVSFHDMRRIMVGVLAFPAQKRVEPFGGGGFAIMQLLNPTVTCSSCQTLSQFSQLQDEADAAASKAFFWWMGGVDIKQGRLALYGHYILTSSARGFLIQGTTHTFQGGIRYSMGSAKEGVTEGH